MVARILVHELLVLRRERALAIALAVFVAALAAAVSTGRAAVVDRQTRAAALIEDDQARATELQRRLAALPTDTGTRIIGNDPRNAGWVGGSLGVQHAVLPPGVLAALAIGQSDVLPWAVPVSTRPPDLTPTADDLANPVLLATGRFDLAFVIVYLLPLVVIGLTFDVLSSEREQGTLALVLSQPVRARTVLVTRTLARAGLAAGLAFAAGLAGVVATGPAGFSSEGILRLALWVAVVCAYTGFWFALAVWVNAVGRGSAPQAVTLAALWLALAFVVPGLIDLSARMVAPVPSRAVLVQALRDASTEPGRQGRELLAAYYEAHPELRPAGREPNLNDFSARNYVTQLAVFDAVRPLAEHLDGQVARQDSLARRWRFSSPALVAQEAMHELAGTGRARHRHFEVQVHGAREAWRAFFVPRMLQGRRLTVEDYDVLPRFVFEEEPLGVVAERTAIGLVGLVLPSALLLFGAISRLRRRDLLT